MTVALTTQQGAQLDALAACVWALLDAEAQGNRALAASAVPVFCASWNAWGGAVRAVYPDSAGSLSLSGGGWSHAHDDALKTTLATFVQTQHSLSTAQIDHLLTILDVMPSGMPFQAYRGVWFDTNFAAALPASPTFEFVCDSFAQGGASALSSTTGQISQGIDPSPLPQVPSMLPSVPQQTDHPSSAAATAFVMPRSQTLPEIDISGRAPASQESFPVAAVVGITAVAAVGIAFGGYELMRRLPKARARRRRRAAA